MSPRDGGVMYLGVDLAERHTAAVLSNEADEVLYYSFLDAGTAIKKEAGGPKPQIHLRALAKWWKALDSGIRLHQDIDIRSTVLTVENIFPHAMNGVPAARMQGGILLLATMYGMEAELVMPNIWQNALGYSKPEHGKSKPWARDYAETALGFVMPETQMDGSRMYAKQKEDMPDALLINHWRRTRREKS